MNIRELIAKLQEHDPETKVFIKSTDCYDTGCHTSEEEVDSVRKIKEGVLLQEF